MSGTWQTPWVYPFCEPLKEYAWLVDTVKRGTVFFVSPGSFFAKKTAFPKGKAAQSVSFSFPGHGGCRLEGTVPAALLYQSPDLRPGDNSPADLRQQARAGGNRNRSGPESPPGGFQ